MRYLLVLLLAGCGPIPVQISKQDQTQEQSVSQEVANDQKSSHASESKQGTNSMPVIIICNMNNSSRGHCATPSKGGAVEGAVDSQLKKGNTQ